MTDIVKAETTALTLASDQVAFSPEQVRALEHIGVADASSADLAVFFHVCKRSGLDPFARQIHMIGRKNKRADGTYEVKQTIQTGIDGYRLIGRRAVASAGERVSVGAPEWAHEDGSWRPVWTKAWGVPVAAKVVVSRAGEPFTAVAMYDEYVQTARDGRPNRMWAQRPAGQLAKCAEALAWRMACPQDLAGIYTDDEMGQADNPAPMQPASTSSGIAAVLAEADAADEPSDGEVMLDPDSDIGRELYALFTQSGIGKAGAQQFYQDLLGRTVADSRDLTEAEALRCIDALLAELPQEGSQS